MIDFAISRLFIPEIRIVCEVRVGYYTHHSPAYLARVRGYLAIFPWFRFPWRFASFVASGEQGQGPRGHREML